MFSREKDIQKNIRVLLPKLEQYFSKNNFKLKFNPKYIFGFLSSIQRFLFLQGTVQILLDI